MGRWRDVAVPLVPAAVLAALGGLLLSRRPSLWYDELFTAETAGVPLPDLLRAVAAGEGTAAYLPGISPSYNAPYYVAVKAWLGLTPFEADELGLRLLSLVAAVAAVAVLARAVQLLAGRVAGLAAGLAAATSPLLVDYAVEARGYGLAVLATAVAGLGLARWLRGDGLLLYAAGAAAAGLAHWFALPVLAGFAAAAVVLRRGRARRLVVVTALAGLPALALVVLAQVQVGTRPVDFVRDTGGELPLLALRAWSGESLLALGVVVVLALLARGRGAVVGAAWVGVPLLLLVVAELVRPVYVARYLLPALLGLAVLAGTGAARRWPAVLVPVLVGVQLAAAAPLLDRGPREDWRGAVRLVLAERGPSEPVVAVDQRAALALREYAPGAAGVVLPPDDPPAADAVWLLRQTVGGRPRGSDDDALLQARGLRVVREVLLPGSTDPFLVQRWAR